MFRQNSGPGLRGLVFLLLSVALIIFDQRSVSFHLFRVRFSSSLAYPFQSMVDVPIGFVRWVNTTISLRNNLVRENEELRVREILLQSRLQKLMALEKENSRLRQLLQSTSQIPGRVVIARLLAVALDPNLQQVVLNKGSNDEVYAGQPVIDGFGVVGQVVGVGPLTSKVLLITDKESAVPVEDYRNNIRAVAVGDGVSGQLSLINIPDTNDIQIGDMWVTSGLGLHYPVGYPVGTVVQIKHHNNDPTEQIVLSPTARLDQTEQVLLAWPNQTKLTQDIQKELDNPNALQTPQPSVSDTPKKIKKIKTVASKKIKPPASSQPKSAVST